MIKNLDTNEWKIEHRNDGYSFIGIPDHYNNKEHYYWLGPLTRKDAEWLFDAIRLKQSKV